MAVIAAIFLFIALILPLTATHDPLYADTDSTFAQPSLDHFLGTDHLGRDIWSRLVIGGQRTLFSTGIAFTIALIGGITLGSLCVIGWPLSRWWSDIFLDAILAFPALLIALIFRALLGGSLITLGIAIGVSGIAPMAQVARSSLRNAQTALHIDGAMSIGVGWFGLLWRHIIPTAVPTLASFGSVLFGWLLLYQSALSFLGLSGDPTQPDWGLMVSQSRGYLEQIPLFAICPSMMIASCVWLANRVGDVVVRR